MVAIITFVATLLIGGLNLHFDQTVGRAKAYAIHPTSQTYVSRRARRFAVIGVWTTWPATILLAIVTVWLAPSLNYQFIAGITFFFLGLGWCAGLRSSDEQVERAQFENEEARRPGLTL